MPNISYAGVKRSTRMQTDGRAVVAQYQNGDALAPPTPARQYKRRNIFTTLYISACTNVRNAELRPILRRCTGWTNSYPRRPHAAACCPEVALRARCCRFVGGGFAWSRADGTGPRVFALLSIPPRAGWPHFRVDTVFFSFKFALLLTETL